MKKSKKIFSAILSIVLLLSSVTSAFLVQAAETTEKQTGELGYVGTTSDKYGNSGTGLTYKDVFTENWEDGLDLSKWSVEKLDESYISDFQVVDDPLGYIEEKTGKTNQVITYTRLSTWLVPTDDYWPTNGLTAGQVAKIQCRIYLKDIYLEIEEYRPHGQEPGMICNYVSPYEQDGWQFATHDSRDTGASGFAFTSDSWNQERANNRFTWWMIDNGYYTKGFATDDWIDVTITYSKNQMSMSLVDKNGSVCSYRACNKLNDGGKFAVGNRLLEKINNDQQTNGVLYMDDISVTFTQSTIDADAEQADVNAYYAGNTFLNPGDTVDITGEDLGSTVINAQIKKIDIDKSADILDAVYVNETTYDMAPTANVKWEDIPYEEGSLIEDWDIQQRSETGIKMVLPNGSVSGQEMYAQPGSYAVLLEPAVEGAESEVIIINNPQITLLLHDDGNYATPDGWLKLSGYNLSVQNDLSKVSAIIIDENENRTWVNNSNIKIDTTENNGESNDYYMMIHLNNLEPGRYQIIVHNGYGGNYGWSMPYDFTVESKAAYEIWREKGVFNVQNYGAVGDSLANDTAAIQSAINAAVANGGGVVYFPQLKNGKGAGYRITNPLILGKNITLMGDGIDQTILFYDGMLDTEKQEYFISFEKNLEITQMSITCQTNPFKEFLKRNTSVNNEAGKIYIKDAYLLSDRTGATSQAVEVIMEGYNYTSATLYTDTEWSGVGQYLCNFVNVTEDYFCITGTDVVFKRRAGGSNQHMFVHTSYGYYDGYEEDGQVYSVITNKVAAFFENGATQNLSGHTSYRNISNSNQTNNNRELFLRDSKQEVNNVHMQPLLENYTEAEYKVMLESELDKLKTQEERNTRIKEVSAFVEKYQGKAYRFLDYIPKRIQDYWVFITYGQGTGQIRLISNLTKIGSYYYFTIDEPFAVTPNRSSCVSVDDTGAAFKTFINKAYFEDGGYVGVFGNGIDIVFDKITIRKATSGVCFTVGYKGFQWYNTAKNIDAREIAHSHTETGTFGERAGFFSEGEKENGYMALGIRYCDSFIGEGGNLLVRSLGNVKPITVSDIVYENINIISEYPGVTVEDKQGMQGIWLKDIKQYTEEGNAYSEILPYDEASKQKIKSGVEQLLYGTPTIYVDNIDFSQSRQRGDINNDGLITMQDVTLLRYFLGEKTTEEELNTEYGKKTVSIYADITEDNMVDARDFLYLRAYILGDQAAMEAIGKAQGGGSTEEPDTPVVPEEPIVPEEPDIILKEDEIIIDFSTIEDED